MYLTKNDCDRILENYSNSYGDVTGSLVDFKLESFSKDLRGFLGEHLLLTIELSGGDLLKFFVKTVSSTGFIEAIADADIFGKEVFLYSFFKEAKKQIPFLETDCIPVFFYASSNQTIVLENLALQNYHGCKEFDMDDQHMKKALEALAKFHAVSIVYEEYKSTELGRRYELTEDFQKYLDPTFTSEESRDGFKYMSGGLSGCLWMIDAIYKEGTEEMKNGFRERMRFILNLLTENNDFRKVICNGDLWTYNTLFKYENGIPVDCKIVDFQLIRYAPPAHDVTFLVYVGTKRENKQLCVNDYYRFYYDSFRRELLKHNLEISKILPWYEFQSTLKPYTNLIEFIWITHRQITSASPIKLTEVFADTEELILISNTEKRAAFIKEQFDVDPTYRDHLTSLLNENVFSIKYNTIGPEECYRILEDKLHTKEYTITNYELKEGLIENAKILTLHVNNSLVYNFDVKLLQRNNERCYQNWNELELNEVIFHSTIAIDLQKYGRISYVIPKCYLATIDKLVLDYSGIDHGNKHDLFTIDEINKSVEAIAVLHANAVILELSTKAKLNETYKLENKHKPKFVTEFFRKFLQEKYFKTDKLRRICDVLLEKYVESENPSEVYKNTLIHGDLRPANVSFNDQSCVLLNFQRFCYNVPTYDLLQLIYMCSSKDLRDTHMKQVLSYYYVQLNANLRSHCVAEEVFPVEDFWRSCEEQKYIAAIHKMAYLNNFLEVINHPSDMEHIVKDEESIKEFVDMCENYLN